MSGRRAIQISIARFGVSNVKGKGRNVKILNKSIYEVVVVCVFNDALEYSE